MERQYACTGVVTSYGGGSAYGQYRFRDNVTTGAMWTSCSEEEEPWYAVQRALRQPHPGGRWRATYNQLFNLFHLPDLTAVCDFRLKRRGDSAPAAPSLDGPGQCTYADRVGQHCRNRRVPHRSPFPQVYPDIITVNGTDYTHVRTHGRQNKLAYVSTMGDRIEF
ncbi:MAG: hypothetical protein M1838_001995 [Thelocarpon superellum]|nr:MAG: hypothetical protein M1838_001995 [Thelocarpon superellum]